MVRPEAQPLLDPQVLAHAEALGLHARFIVEGYMAGEHKSPFRGFAIEFSQHREYVQGDDVRHIDWKLLGRTDRYYIKQYEQETNFVAHLLLDGSESMKYGSGSISKFHYGKALAACLAYLILSQRDAVAVGVFDSTIREYLPRSDNRAAIHPIMQRLAAFDPRGDTRVGTVLHELARQVGRKGIVVVLSDLFDDEAQILEGIQHLRFVGHEVVVFHILDPYEREFPFKGLVEFHGLESSTRILTRPNEVRKSYLREINGFCGRMREGCERNHCHYVPINTAQSLRETLGSYLAFRQRTLR